MFVNPLQVYFFNTQVSKTVYNTLHSGLQEDEKQRAEKYQFEKDRIAFVCLRGILRILISKYSGIKNNEITISYNGYGKPFFDSFTPLYFNGSHSGAYALIAFSTESEVGVDVEKCEAKRNWQGIIDKNFSEAEKQYILEAGSIQHFYQLWTLKEAFIKCEGTGLFHSLEKIELPVQNLRKGKIFWVKDISLLSLSCPNQDYEAALAVKGEMGAIDIQEINVETFI